jgi:hypothetical protein
MIPNFFIELCDNCSLSVLELLSDATLEKLFQSMIYFYVFVFVEMMLLYSLPERDRKVTVFNSFAIASRFIIFTRLFFHNRAVNIFHSRRPFDYVFFLYK